MPIQNLGLVKNFEFGRQIFNNPLLKNACGQEQVFLYIYIFCHVDSIGVFNIKLYVFFIKPCQTKLRLGFNQDLTFGLIRLTRQLQIFLPNASCPMSTTWSISTKRRECLCHSTTWLQPILRLKVPQSVHNCELQVDLPSIHFEVFFFYSLSLSQTLSKEKQ